MKNSDEKPTVLVTGFGPFGSHEVNASWVAVQELKKVGLGSDANLVVEEIPVEYNVVQKVVPQLWEKHCPKLVVHVGVSGIASAITLEQRAHNDGYHRKDVIGQCPTEGKCVDCCCDNTKESGINMSDVLDVINTSDTGLTAVVSLDPGRYLCDFIYFTSLNIKDNCVAFIHVPPLDKPYSASQLALGLQMAVKAMLQQVQSAS